MKHSFLPLAIISLTLTSCSLIRSVDNVTCKVDTDCSDTEMCYFKPEGTTGSCVAKPGTPGVDDVAAVTTLEAEKTEENTPNPTPNKNPTTPVNNTPKTTVSTEDLTKELDAFVDDITKGL